MGFENFNLKKDAKKVGTILAVTAIGLMPHKSAGQTAPLDLKNAGDGDAPALPSNMKKALDPKYDVSPADFPGAKNNNEAFELRSLSIMELKDKIETTKRAIHDENLNLEQQREDMDTPAKIKDKEIKEQEEEIRKLKKRLNDYKEELDHRGQPLG